MYPSFSSGEVHLAGQDLWLGLKGDEETESWSWVDGTHLTFTNWQAGHHYIEDGLCAQVELQYKYTNQQYIVFLYSYCNSGAIFVIHYHYFGTRVINRHCI